VGSRLGVSTEKIEALNQYAKSPLFTDAEKVALEYADAMTETRRDVDDELFARVQRHYDDDTIAEMTMIIAWENAVLALQPGVPHPIARVLEAMTET
jgi:alkylhydroperoxidase family enzyme